MVGLLRPAGSVGGSTAIVAASLVQSGKYRRVLAMAWEKQSESNAMWALSLPVPFTAPVGAGSELLADGSIHVYAPLRGRALAGVSGDTDARIFCRQLSAELLSIAGYHIVNEEIADAALGQPVHVRLEGDHLLIETVD